VAVLAIATFLLSLHTGRIVADSRHELNLDAIHSYSQFFAAWSDATSLGQDNTWNVAYVFPFGFAYWLGYAVLGTAATQAAILSVILSTGFAGMLRLLRGEAPIVTWPVRLVLALLTVLNPYTMTSITDAYTVLLLPLVALPWQMLAVKALVTNKLPTPAIALVLALTVLLMGGVNPPLDAISGITLLAWSAYLRPRWAPPRVLLRRLAVAAPIVFAVNAFWLVGALSFFGNASSNTVSAILSEPLSVQNRRSSYFNAVRGVGLWALDQSNQGVPYYRYGAELTGDWAVQVFELAVPMLALVSLLVNRAAVRRLWPLLALTAFSVVMIVGTNQGPFAQIYQWSYDHFPGFAMFRSSYKFTSIYYLVLCVIIAVGLDQGSRIPRVERRLLTLLMAGAATVLSLPLWTRTVLNSDNIYGGPPSEYAAVGRLLAADPGDYRVMLLPGQYFARYTWGQPKGNPEVLWKRGLVAQQPGDPTEVGNALSVATTRAVLANRPDAAALLRDLDVKYIVQRNDYDWRFYPTVSQAPQTVASALAHYRKVAAIGALDVYATDAGGLGSVRISDPAATVHYVRESSTSYLVAISGLRGPSAELSLLVSRNAGWNATVDDGSPLVPAQAASHGYANAWTLPADRRTPSRPMALHIRFEPQRRLDWGLGISLISTTAAIGLAARALRRRHDSDVRGGIEDGSRGVVAVGR